MRKLTISSFAAIAVIAIATLGIVQLAFASTDDQVSAKEFSFHLSRTSVAKPGTVTFEVKNNGHILHDFKVNGEKTHLIQPGKTARLVVRFTEKGHYHYLCTLPGHAAAGMKGVFTVR